VKDESDDVNDDLIDGGKKILKEDNILIIDNNKNEDDDLSLFSGKLDNSFSKLNCGENSTSSIFSYYFNSASFPKPNGKKFLRKQKTINFGGKFILNMFSKFYSNEREEKKEEKKKKDIVKEKKGSDNMKRNKEGKKLDVNDSNSKITLPCGCESILLETCPSFIPHLIEVSSGLNVDNSSPVLSTFPLFSCKCSLPSSSSFSSSSSSDDNLIYIETPTINSILIPSWISSYINYYYSSKNNSSNSSPTSDKNLGNNNSSLFYSPSASIRLYMLPPSLSSLPNYFFNDNNDIGNDYSKENNNSFPNIGSIKYLFSILISLLINV
jgi:hypothetical protein